MRLPRVRFTIGRLMIAVLVPALALWAVLICLQVSDERRAKSAYDRAVLTLEVAETALKEYVEAISPENFPSSMARSPSPARTESGRSIGSRHNGETFNDNRDLLEPRGMRGPGGKYRSL